MAAHSLTSITGKKKRKDSVAEHLVLSPCRWRRSRRWKLETPWTAPRTTGPRTTRPTWTSWWSTARWGWRRGPRWCVGAARWTGQVLLTVHHTQFTTHSSPHTVHRSFMVLFICIFIDSIFIDSSFFTHLQWFQVYLLYCLFVYLYLSCYLLILIWLISLGPGLFIVLFIGILLVYYSTIVLPQFYSFFLSYSLQTLGLISFLNLETRGFIPILTCSD